MNPPSAEAVRRSRPYVGAHLVLIVVCIGLALLTSIRHPDNPDRLKVAAFFIAGALGLSGLIAFDLKTEISNRGVRRPLGELIPWKQVETMTIRSDSILLRSTSGKTIRLYWVQFRDQAALLKFIEAQLAGDSSGKSEQASPTQSSSR